MIDRGPDRLPSHPDELDETEHVQCPICGDCDDHAWSCPHRALTDTEMDEQDIQADREVTT